MTNEYMINNIEYLAITLDMEAAIAHEISENCILDSPDSEPDILGFLEVFDPNLDPEKTPTFEEALILIHAIIPKMVEWSRQYAIIELDKGIDSIFEEIFYVAKQHLRQMPKLFLSEDDNQSLDYARIVNVSASDNSHLIHVYNNGTAEVNHAALKGGACGATCKG